MLEDLANAQGHVRDAKWRNVVSLVLTPESSLLSLLFTE